MISTKRSNILKQTCSWKLQVCMTFNWTPGIQGLNSQFVLPKPSFTGSKLTIKTTRTRREIWSKLTIKARERRHWCRSGVFIVNFELISHLVLEFLLLTGSTLIQDNLHNQNQRTEIGSINGFWEDITSDVSRNSILRLLHFVFFPEHGNSYFAMCRRYYPCILGKYITEVSTNLSNFTWKLFSWFEKK